MPRPLGTLWGCIAWSLKFYPSPSPASTPCWSKCSLDSHCQDRQGCLCEKLSECAPGHCCGRAGRVTNSSLAEFFLIILESVSHLQENLNKQLAWGVKNPDCWSFERVEDSRSPDQCKRQTLADAGLRLEKDPAPFCLCERTQFQAKAEVGFLSISPPFLGFVSQKTKAQFSVLLCLHPTNLSKQSLLPVGQYSSRYSKYDIMRSGLRLKKLY